MTTASTSPKTSSRTRNQASATPSAADSSTQIAPPSGGLRAPCPCGSGKRYKQCHGRIRTAEAFVARPFEGLPRETDFVAFREIVPAATMAATTVDGDAVVFATVLPGAWPALRRPDGTVWVGVQTSGASADISRDLAVALTAGIAADPGHIVEHVDGRGTATRLQDLLGGVEPAKVHEDFSFWVEGLAEDDELGARGTLAGIRASLERANEAIITTEHVTSVDSAFWVRMGGTTFVRWVVPFDEDAFMAGLARLHAQGGDESGAAGSSLGEGTRFAGAFRAHGLLVPVWDLSSAGTAESCEEPLAQFAERINEAMAVTSPLTPDERRARAGLVSRQVTLR